MSCSFRPLSLSPMPNGRPAMLGNGPLSAKLFFFLLDVRPGGETSAMFGRLDEAGLGYRPLFCQSGGPGALHLRSKYPSLEPYG